MRSGLRVASWPFPFAMRSLWELRLSDRVRLSRYCSTGSAAIARCILGYAVPSAQVWGLYFRSDQHHHLGKVSALLFDCHQMISLGNFYMVSYFKDGFPHLSLELAEFSTSQTPLGFLGRGCIFVETLASRLGSAL